MRQLNVSNDSRVLVPLALAFAWAGSVLFAVSLLWFLYCYLVRFDRLAVETDSTIATILTDVALFSVFALHHSVLARTAVKRYVDRIVTQPLERSVYTWTASLLFLAVCTFWRPVPATIYQLQGTWRLAGYGLQLLGVVLTVRAASKLDVLDLSGVRAAGRAQSDPQSDPQSHNVAPQHVPLETTGVYGFVRHPLYFAWMCFVCGAPDMTATRALFAVVSTSYLAIAIPLEERGLVATFGADYQAYRRKVRWRMIPGIY